MQYPSDPVKDGLIASLARPGGNVTGVTAITPQLSGKCLELLKEAFPRLTRVVAVDNKEAPTDLEELEQAASALTLQLRISAVDVRDIENSLTAALADDAEAMLVRGGLVVDPTLIARVVQLAAQRRIPAMYTARQATTEGGLMSFGPNSESLNLRSAYYVDRILKGALPADLPVEHPREFDFIINLKTAQALGLTIPKHVLLQATEVIQ